MCTQLYADRSSVRKRVFSVKVATVWFLNSGISMLFNPCTSVLKLTERSWDGERPYWSYEDIGIFLLVLSALSALLDVLSYLHLLPRSQLAHPGFALQTSVIVTLMVVLYLVLKLRYRQAVLRPLGWIWRRRAFVIIAPLVGGFLAAGIAFSLHGYAHATGTMPFVGTKSPVLPVTNVRMIPPYFSEPTSVHQLDFHGLVRQTQLKLGFVKVGRTHLLLRIVGSAITLFRHSHKVLI